MTLLERNQDKINWDKLSGNVNAIPLLETNQDKINWDNLSGNVNAISLLEKNMDKIDWPELSSNYNAIHLLDNGRDIDWFYFTRYYYCMEHDIGLIQDKNKLCLSRLCQNKNAIPFLEKLEYNIKES